MPFVLLLQAIALAASGVEIRRLRRNEQARASEVTKLAHLALVDSLTGLRNRRAFDEELSQALSARERGVIPPRLCLAMLDIRGLKRINDSLGHQAGDERLMRLSTALRAGTRGSDSVYRLGGDEFMLILPGQGADDARRLVARLGADLLEEGIDIAAGIAEAAVSVTANALVGRADRALVAAKRGPTTIVLWSPGLDRAASSRTRDPGERPQAH